MNSELEPVFVRLRSILQKNAGTLSVGEDSPQRFALEGAAGPAAVRAWRGELRKPKLPVAWVQIGKAYVSYHLMCVYGNPELLNRMSKELRARMQGKTCFNFKRNDAALFAELENVTVQGFAAFKKAGFVRETNPA